MQTNCIDYPAIIPEEFNGSLEKGWDEWIEHFECVSRVNQWDKTKQSQWLSVRLTDKAQTAWRLLSSDVKSDYDLAKTAMKRRFEPESRRELYATEFRTLTRQNNEPWGDIADKLNTLCHKAFPTLDQKDREHLVLCRFLDLLENPEVAFSVRQSRPKTIEDAVDKTLEIECYMSILPTVSPTVMTTQVNGQCCEDINKDHNDNNSLMMLGSIKLLTEQVEQLKIMMSKLRTHPDSLIACGSEMSGKDKAIDCSRCEREGHNCRGGSSVRSSAEIRMAWNQPSAMGQDKNCRLCDHTANQICMCNNTCYNTTRVDLLAVNPTKAYHVSGSVNGAPVRFMLDTGATVSLIREDVVVGANTTLAKCNLRLVGVEGSAIVILGVATLETLFPSIIATGDFIVAKTLSTETIIGLDFLEQNHCTINMEQKVLHLRGKALPLKGAEDSDRAKTQ